VLATAEARAACATGPTCETCDLSTFTPAVLNPPIGPLAGVCSADEIAAFVQACLAPDSTTTTCGNYPTSADPACSSCLASSSSDKSWGMLLCDNGCGVNTAGCVDLFLDQVAQEKNAGGPGSCGDVLAASYSCENFSCGECTTTNGDLDWCHSDADDNQCAPYYDAQFSKSGPCAGFSPSGSPCSPTDAAGFAAMATFMCGSQAPADAGADGGAGPSKKQTGCSCDATGSAASSPFALAAFVALSIARRRRARR
jgi:MYXO-CTERM domain-containing protein